MRRVHVPPGLGILLGRMIGPVVGDVLLTDAELRGLMDSLLTSPQPLARHFSWRPAA